MTRTEGWPAALVLAGLWLQRVDEPSEAVRTFGGNHHLVASYLSGEVLGARNPGHWPRRADFLI